MIAATFLGRTQVEYHFDAIQDYIPGAYSMSEAEMTFHDGAVKRSREILGDDAEAVREGLAAKIVMRLTSKPYVSREYEEAYYAEAEIFERQRRFCTDRR